MRLGNNQQPLADSICLDPAVAYAIVSEILPEASPRYPRDAMIKGQANSALKHAPARSWIINKVNRSGFGLVLLPRKSKLLDDRPIQIIVAVEGFSESDLRETLILIRRSFDRCQERMQKQQERRGKRSPRRRACRTRGWHPRFVT